MKSPQRVCLQLTSIKELKSRGVEVVLLFVSDSLKGMADPVFNVFPKAK